MTTSDLILTLSQKNATSLDTLLNTNLYWFMNINIMDPEDDASSSEDDENYDDFDDEDNKPICACGKTLSAGWKCTHCRNDCSTCHRALAPEEECSRCAPH
ncbi:hypothetical protein G6F56_008002 [Rhizopus delemar]|nr:hypothetical protein G6F56_008002 [Rhizopus delemar]